VSARLRVAVVIPAYNEEGKIGRVLAKIPPGVVDLTIVVDDASRDGTAEEARRGGATVVSHARNRGVGATIRTGLDHARARGLDVVAVLSGDDQHVPSELPDVLAPLVAGAADLVQGSRRLVGGVAVEMNLFRRLTTRVYPLLFRLATGYPSTDATNGFRAFRLSIFDDPRIDLWQDWLDTYELEPYLLYKAVVTGKRVVEVPVTVVYHTRGTTKMKAVRDWWRILRPLVYLRLGWRR
jgi:dolichol-phosphate mannosyltransferase